MTATTRDAFQVWARKECSATDLDLSRNQDGYFTNEWRRAFSAWEAATAAERERAASKVNLTTLRKRTLYGMQNGEAVKECELATAIRSGK